jgi:hypothetical protein
VISCILHSVTPVDLPAFWGRLVLDEQKFTTIHGHVAGGKDISASYPLDALHYTLHCGNDETLLNVFWALAP